MQSNTSGQSQSARTMQRTNQNAKHAHVANAKRGKMCVGESRLVLASLLIGRESGATFQSKPIVRRSLHCLQNQSKRECLVFSQVKTAPHSYGLWILLSLDSSDPVTRR